MLDDEQKFLANIRRAETDDLLNRVTVERWGMDPDAVRWIKEELASRDVTPAMILDYETQFEGCLRDEQGRWVICSYCRKPAVVRCWGWHRLWKRIPIFPRVVSMCKDHAAKPNG